MQILTSGIIGTVTQLLLQQSWSTLQSSDGAFAGSPVSGFVQLDCTPLKPFTSTNAAMRKIAFLYKITQRALGYYIQKTLPLSNESGKSKVTWLSIEVFLSTTRQTSVTLFYHDKNVAKLFQLSCATPLTSKVVYF